MSSFGGDASCGATVKTPIDTEKRLRLDME